MAINEKIIVKRRIPIADGLYLCINAAGTGADLSFSTLADSNTKTFAIESTTSQNYTNIKVLLTKSLNISESSAEKVYTIANLQGNSTHIFETSNTYTWEKLERDYYFIVIAEDHNIEFLCKIFWGEWYSTPTIHWHRIQFTSLPSFNDEENPTVGCITFHKYSQSNTSNEVVETIRIGILEPNSSEFLIYRDYTNWYSGEGPHAVTFYFTDDERERLRAAYPNSVTNKIKCAAHITNSKSIRINPSTKEVTTYDRLSYQTYYRNSNNQYSTAFYTRMYDEVYEVDTETVDTAKLTIVNANPILNPTIKDIKPETLALTGDENIFIKYESMAEFGTGATAIKGAEIVSQSVENSGKKVEDMYFGIFDDVETATFVFNATDSRGLRADPVVVHKTLIEYFKPTCYQDLEIGLSAETSAEVNIKVTGNFFNGSFGAVNNTLLLEVRYGEKDGELGNWMPLSGTPTFSDGKYELNSVIDGFEYEKAYTFQCRATDKLNYVQSSQYTIRLLPVYDWSETDFNFNVPVKMNGKTVLRHNTEANNTVLSASGGHIYLRPAGTDETTGETIIYPDGSIKFGGSVDFGENAEINSAITFNNTTSFNYSLTIGDHILNDFVIETGSEAMGTNGTWYWTKWASGKAECWGSRNFGNMAVTTKWGTLYRSEALTQDLPNDLFAATPAVININMNNSSFGGWICRYEETAPDETNTGSFIYVRPASATATPTHIGFHVIGRWQ